MEDLQTETADLTAIVGKCAHADCACTVPPGQRYCGEKCRAHDHGEHKATADDDDDEDCNCGHAACEDAHEPVLPPGAMSAVPTG